MTNLSTCSVLSRQDLSIDDNATSNTCSKCDHDHIAVTNTAAFPHLAKCCDIRIISKLCCQSCQFFQLFLCILIFPAKIRRTVDNSIYSNRSRHTDTDSLHIVPGDSLFCQLSLNRLSHIRQNRCSAVFLIRLDLPFVNELSIRLKKSDLAGRSPYVNSKCIFFHASILLFPICILASFSVRYVLCRCLYPCL